MADTYIAPPAGGVASDNVSPVTASQIPASRLTNVGPRGADGLPTGGDGIDSLITRAYDLLAHRPYRAQLLFDSLATLRPTRQSHNGAVISLNLVTDLADDPASALLVEDFDVLPVPLASFRSDIILREYGRVVTSTALARGTSMIPLDPIAAERVGRNMGSTIDRVAMNALLATGGIKSDGSPGGAVADITVAGSPSDTLRAASQRFKEGNVEPFADGLYRAVLTPAAETALRKEADAAGWRYWQINQEESGGTGSIARGFVGVYEGFAIMTSTNVPANLGGIYVAEDALAKGFSAAPGFGAGPQVTVSPVVDRLKRFASVGWYWMGGYARFRAEGVLTGNPLPPSTEGPDVWVLDFTGSIADRRRPQPPPGVNNLWSRFRHPETQLALLLHRDGRVVESASLETAEALAADDVVAGGTVWTGDESDWQFHVLRDAGYTLTEIGG